MTDATELQTSDGSSTDRFAIRASAIACRSPSKFDVRDYGGRTVLDAINLDVRQGETLVILGGSGSGKSTLLRLMIGNVRPDGGDILIATARAKSICAA